MSEGVLASLIAGILAVLGSFVGNYAMTLKKSREQAVRDAEREQYEKDKLNSIDEKIERLEKKVDTHNGYAEKFAKNSEKLAVLGEKIDFNNQTMERMQKDIEYLKSDRCKV